MLLSNRNNLFVCFFPSFFPCRGVSVTGRMDCLLGTWYLVLARLLLWDHEARRRGYGSDPRARNRSRTLSFPCAAAESKKSFTAESMNQSRRGKDAKESNEVVISDATKQQPIAVVALN